MEEKGKAAKVCMVIAFSAILAISMLPAGMSSASNGTEVSHDAPSDPTPDYIVDRDMIVSYDEPENLNNALHPSVATAPPGSPFEDCTYTVWDEYDEFSGYKEIHFSMSPDGGMTWTHDRDDFLISAHQKDKANYGNAVNPSIAVDSNGLIHVVWAERISADGTWEIFYSRSGNNGETWTGTTTGDIPVSHRLGGGQDGTSVSAPKIAVGMVNNRAQEILHVVWSEYTTKDGQEVHYSRSLNGGDVWSGMEVDAVISNPDFKFAYNPSIVTSGPEARFVHVAWTQMANYELNEAFYVSSPYWGDQGTWGEEMPISMPANDGMTILNMAISGGYNDQVHAVWTQQDLSKKAPEIELYTSSSPDNGQTWTGRDKDWPISFPDGNPASVPTLSASPNSIHAAWTEIDETSPFATKEIHTSWTSNPFDPEAWTGLKSDIVISNWDEWGEANANNVSMAQGFYKGEYYPIFVWDEMNDKPTEKRDRADKNIEIHTNPADWTLDIIVSGNGYVVKDPDQSSYGDGDLVTLTAYGYAGWSFSNWGGDLSGSANPETITMDDDKSVIAYFTEDQYTLTITIIGSGSVSKNPNQATYTYGQSVTLTATPSFGWRFDHWAGALSGSTNPTSTTMYSSKTVNAYFVQNINYVNLTSGWNIVSLPYIQSNTSVASVLSSISGSFDYVKYFNSLDTADPWKTYRVGGTANDLTNIDHKMSFWIHTTAPCTLSVYGNIPVSTSIQLYTGWNMVGYPSGTPRQASATLPGVADHVGVWSATAPYVTDYTDKTLVTMSKGNGYWIHVTADATWNVNW